MREVHSADSALARGSPRRSNGNVGQDDLFGVHRYLL